MRRFAKYCLLVFAGALVGLPSGYLYAYRELHDGAEFLSQTLALSQYETLANLQYKQSDPLHGKLAQLDLLNFMQQLEAKQKIAVPRALDYDRATALMRLALLEEKAGNRQQAEEYILKAQRSLNEADHKWYSEEKVRKFIAKADSESQY
jgi:hypothetical protein